MARKPRIEFPGGLYHVLARGNRRNKTFLSVSDYSDYTRRLWRYCKEGGHTLYSYCLMPNHVHILVQMSEKQLSRTMHKIQFSYTQAFNHRHNLTGHVFEGRYKAILCQKEQYLFQLIRYIPLNPVRANIVNDPKEYTWSSHRLHMAKDGGWPFKENPTLKLFSNDVKKARALYEQFVRDGIEEGHRDDLYHCKEQRILGDDYFVCRILEDEMSVVT